MCLVKLEFFFRLELSIIYCSFDVSYIFDNKIGRTSLVNDLRMNSRIIKSVLFFLRLSCFGFDLMFHDHIFFCYASYVFYIIYNLGILFVSNFINIVIIFVFGLTFRKNQLFVLFDNHWNCWLWFFSLLFFFVWIWSSKLTFLQNFFFEFDILV